MFGPSSPQTTLNTPKYAKQRISIMLADIKQPDPKDLTRINVGDALEVQWWSLRFNVTPQAPRAAVEELGPSAEGVRRKLQAAAKESFDKGGED